MAGKNKEGKSMKKHGINTHGLTLRGLRKASGATIDWPARSRGLTQISYDRATGDVLTNHHVGDSWTVYRDPDVVTICYTERHMTMQEIADKIARAMAEIKEVEF